MARVKMTAKEKKDNKEFFEALKFMEQERGIPREFIADKISEAITVAARKDYGGNDIVSCLIAAALRLLLNKNIFSYCTQRNCRRG